MVVVAQAAVVDGDDLHDVLRRGAAQDGVDASDEFFGAKWFGDVVVCAAFEAAQFVALLCAGGEHEDGQCGAALVAAQLGEPCDAFAVGQHPVRTLRRR